MRKLSEILNALKGTEQETLISEINLAVDGIKAKVEAKHTQLNSKYEELEKTHTTLKKDIKVNEVISKLTKDETQKKLLKTLIGNVEDENTIEQIAKDKMEEFKDVFSKETTLTPPTPPIVPEKDILPKKVEQGNAIDKELAAKVQSYF